MLHEGCDNWKVPNITCSQCVDINITRGANVHIRAYAGLGQQCSSQVDVLNTSLGTDWRMSASNSAGSEHWATPHQAILSFWSHHCPNAYFSHCWHSFPSSATILALTYLVINLSTQLSYMLHLGLLYLNHPKTLGTPGAPMNSFPCLGLLKQVPAFRLSVLSIPIQCGLIQRPAIVSAFLWYSAAFVPSLHRLWVQSESQTNLQAMLPWTFVPDLYFSQSDFHSRTRG